MHSATNNAFPRTYRMMPLIRYLVLGIAIAVGALVLFGLVFFDAPIRDAMGNIKPPLREDPGSYVVLTICALVAYYVVIRRVVLFDDAFEAHGLFGAKRYSRADIGDAGNGRIAVIDTQKIIAIPLNIHPDHIYAQWFYELPKLHWDGDKWVGKTSKRFTSDASHNAQISMDVVENISQGFNTSKGKASLIIFAYMLLTIIVCVFIKMGAPNIGWFVQLGIGIIILTLCIFIPLMLYKISKKSRKSTNS